MIGPLTYLDLALIAVAFISGILAMYRGLTRELMSILSWIVAALATLYFILNYRKIAEDMAQQMGAQVAVAQIVIGAVIFLIVLIVVHLITARLSDAILDSRVGMIDRILGFVFGVARGFLLIVIPYMFYESFIPDSSSHYPWIRDSKSLPYIKSTGAAIRSVLETHLPSSVLGQSPPSGEPPAQ
jgi:membrane protein required for colicin V production